MPQLMKISRAHSHSYRSWAVRLYRPPCGYRRSFTADVICLPCIMVPSVLAMDSAVCASLQGQSSFRFIHGPPLAHYISFVILLQRPPIQTVPTVLMMADWQLLGTRALRDARQFVHDTGHGPVCPSVWEDPQFLICGHFQALSFLTYSGFRIANWAFSVPAPSPWFLRAERAKSMQILLRDQARHIPQVVSWGGKRGNWSDGSWQGDKRVGWQGSGLYGWGRGHLWRRKWESPEHLGAAERRRKPRSYKISLWTLPLEPCEQTTIERDLNKIKSPAWAAPTWDANVILLWNWATWLLASSAK